MFHVYCDLVCDLVLLKDNFNYSIYCWRDTYILDINTINNDCIKIDAIILMIEHKVPNYRLQENEDLLSCQLWSQNKHALVSY